MGELRAGAEPLPVGGCERVRKVPLPPAVVLDLVHVDHGAQVVGLIYPQFEVIRAIMLDDSPYVLMNKALTAAMSISCVCMVAAISSSPAASRSLECFSGISMPPVTVADGRLVPTRARLAR